MMMNIPTRVFWFVAVFCLAASLAAAQKKPPSIYPVAVLSFAERGATVKGQGEGVSDIVFALLSAQQPQLVLVERKEIKQILQELELSASGVVAKQNANRLGEVVGAKILVTGSVFKAGTRNYIVAKVIGTETSRVFGASVCGVEEIPVLAEKLAKQIGDRIVRDGAKLMPPPRSAEQQVAALVKAMAGKRLPPCTIRIQEKHIGQSSTDPAAQTELTFLYGKAGGTVVDPGKQDPHEIEIKIIGEGVSEFAGEIHGLKSVKARVELKALDRRGKVLAVERQTVAKVDVTEALAGKQALQEAAVEIALRLLPKLTR